MVRRGWIWLRIV